MANRIELDVQAGHHEEAAANAALYPGHLVERMSTGKVRKHTTYGGYAELLIAKEDALQGKTTTQAYAADDVVSLLAAVKQDKFQVRVPANALAIVINDFLISDGAGAFVKAPADGKAVLYASAAASTAVSNTVNTEQDYDVSYTLPANTLKVGDILKISGHVVVSAAASTDTIIIKVYIGATALVATAAIDSTTADVGVFELNLVVRTIGASGTFVMFGETGVGPQATGTMKPCHLASTAIDTTATKVIKASSTWSATSATCTSALQSLVVELQSAGNRVPLVVAAEALDNSAVAAEALIAVRAL